jgi:type IV secretory pathway VirB2 component (pilin)
MVALLLAGIALLMRGGRTAGAIAVTLAALVKPYAVLTLPAFWRPWDWRVPAAVGATVLICYAPYLGAGASVLGFLGGGYVAEEGLSSGTGIWLVALLQSLTGPVPMLAAAYVVMAAAVMLVLGLQCGFDPRRGPRETVRAVILLVITGLVLLSPNYAWYFLALVPFIPLGAGAIGWALTLGAFLLYRPIYLGPDNDLIWKSLATAPFLLLLAGRLGQRALRRQGLGHAA